MNKPTLKSKERYALVIDGKYVSNSQSDPIRITDKPQEARLFTGSYLENTCWEWQYFCKPIPASELKRPQERQGASGGKKTQLKSKNAS